MKGPALLVLNRGSSTVKCALFTAEREPQALLRQSVELAAEGDASSLRPWLEAQQRDWRLLGVGHRLVHPGRGSDEPRRLTDAAVAELGEAVSFAPLHLPGELALVEAVRRLLPDIAQVACFDTAFFRDLPAVARRLPIPSHYDREGLHRYGFHGLSYTYLTDALARVAGREANGRVILAHLGSGSSLAALSGGRPLDTTMGATPLGGVPMATRSGDLDPGLVCQIARRAGRPVEALERLLAEECGLVALSGTTGDMRQLLMLEADDPRARLAVDLYCYRIRQVIGAYAATLGGIETVVFSGGIGERAAPVRARICDGLAFLGLELDAAANARSAAVISSPGAGVTVRVLATDEELVIARAMAGLLIKEGPPWDSPPMN